MSDSESETVTCEFKFLVGRVKQRTYVGDPSDLYDWIEALQKKQLIFGLTDKQLVLLEGYRSGIQVQRWMAIFLLYTINIVNVVQCFWAQIFFLLYCMAAPVYLQNDDSDSCLIRCPDLKNTTWADRELLRVIPRYFHCGTFSGLKAESSPYLAEVSDPSSYMGTYKSFLTYGWLRPYLELL